MFLNVSCNIMLRDLSISSVIQSLSFVKLFVNTLDSDHPSFSDILPPHSHREHYAQKYLILRMRHH